MKHFGPAPQDRAQNRDWAWQCLHCRAPLAGCATGFRCSGCKRDYPVVAGIPLLVNAPAAYLASGCASLRRALKVAERRCDRADATLPEIARARHREVAEAEIARLKLFLGLLGPSCAEADTPAQAAAGRQAQGWPLDALVPYLMRDWTGTAELAATAEQIGAVLSNAMPDARERSVVFAACGAGGLLARLGAGFGRALGFDLTLPVLAAARRLLDGESLDLPLSRRIAGAGRMTLSGGDKPPHPGGFGLVAMDACETALADASVDCVVTSFMLDLMPDPLRLAYEINRVLAGGGVWINYGPSGPLAARWRFDLEEVAAFLHDAGFGVIEQRACRATYLDLSRDLPAWSFRSHICYLTAARKIGPPPARAPAPVPPLPADSGLVPEHFPQAELIAVQGLGATDESRISFRTEPAPGRGESVAVGSAEARALMLVDGERTLAEIARLLGGEFPADVAGEAAAALTRYAARGLLRWRVP
ncbi:MAG TPA: methyltransferase domain-containing protein [Acetobacteraceae bacterium]|nr:methyltransferase domain-containing protein [Acetobacteraceae bacterium]